jgi:hypothetical protein
MNELPGDNVLSELHDACFFSYNMWHLPNQANSKKFGNNVSYSRANRIDSK